MRAMDEMKLERDGTLCPYTARKAPELDYLGVNEDGDAVAWMSAVVPSRDRHNALRQWRREGLTIERVTTEEAKRRLTAERRRRSSATPTGSDR